MILIHKNGIITYMSFHSFGERMFDLSIEAVQPMAELNEAAFELKPYERADMLDSDVARQLSLISEMSSRSKEACVEVIRSMQSGHLLDTDASAKLARIIAKDREDKWIDQKLATLGDLGIRVWQHDLESSTKAHIQRISTLD